MKLRSVLLSRVLPLFLAVSSAAVLSSAQTRDHLTPEEVDLVKDSQALDLRMAIFVKAIDRRLGVITGAGPGTEKEQKQQKKDSEKWGALPTGSRAELVGDIAKILDEAITNIDDVSSRDEKNPLIAKALRSLAAETTRVMGQLKPLQEQAKSDAEIAIFQTVNENAESILEAAKKLPPPAEKKEKKGSKKDTN